MPPPIKLIACGIFEGEYRLLPERLRRRFEATFLESMLHMDPEALEARLGALLPPRGEPFVLLYGDCAPHMREFRSRSAVAIDAVNCCQIVLGERRYARMRKRKSFFLLPEWARRWEEVFVRRLGFTSSELARTYMRESAAELVYLDTESTPVPRADLRAASEYLGLPFRVIRTGRRGLAKVLKGALTEIGR